MKTGKFGESRWQDVDKRITIDRRNDKVIDVWQRHPNTVVNSNSEEDSLGNLDADGNIINDDLNYYCLTKF